MTYTVAGGHTSILYYFRLDRKHGARMLCGGMQEPFGVLFSYERDKFSPVNIIVLCVNDYEATIEE